VNFVGLGRRDNSLFSANERRGSRFRESRVHVQYKCKYKEKTSKWTAESWPKILDKVLGSKV
jgi:hypothetical protein